jgi:hypothetical protein
MPALPLEKRALNRGLAEDRAVAATRSLPNL